MEQVLLYKYKRAPRQFLDALLTGIDLQPIREKMAAAGCECVMADSAAKIFVWPHQYHGVMARLADLDMPLHSSHVVVANSLIPYLEACIASIPSSKNVRVMRDDIRIIATTPKLREAPETESIMMTQHGENDDQQQHGALSPQLQQGPTLCDEAQADHSACLTPTVQPHLESSDDAAAALSGCVDLLLESSIAIERADEDARSVMLRY